MTKYKIQAMYQRQVVKRFGQNQSFRDNSSVWKDDSAFRGFG